MSDRDIYLMRNSYANDLLIYRSEATIFNLFYIPVILFMRISLSRRGVPSSIRVTLSVSLFFLYVYVCVYLYVSFHYRKWRINGDHASLRNNRASRGRANRGNISTIDFWNDLSLHHLKPMKCSDVGTHYWIQKCEWVNHVVFDVIIRSFNAFNILSSERVLPHSSPTRQCISNATYISCNRVSDRLKKEIL